MILTEKDLKNLSLICFSQNGFKLFDNEKLRKKVNDKWITLKMNMPEGAPDQIGWDTKTGLFVGNEIKTINDRLSDEQKNFLDTLVVDGCFAFLTKQINEKEVEITNWSSKDTHTIMIEEYIK